MKPARAYVPLAGRQAKEAKRRFLISAQVSKQVSDNSQWRGAAAHGG